MSLSLDFKKKNSSRTLCCLVFFQPWELRDAFGIFCTSKTVRVPSQRLFPHRPTLLSSTPLASYVQKIDTFLTSTCNQWSHVLIKENLFVTIFYFLQLENGGWEIGSRKDWDPKAIHHGKKVFFACIYVTYSSLVCYAVFCECIIEIWLDTSENGFSFSFFKAFYFFCNTRTGTTLSSYAFHEYTGRGTLT